jgi:uncharacterized membrane protein YeaQ/YmgE (transglycosylase-associated protein family)
MSIFAFLIVGFVAGLIARALVSGPGPEGLIRTTLLGVVGSFVGGFLGNLISGRDLDDIALRPAGLLGSILGAILVLLVYRHAARRRAPRRRAPRR